MTKPQYLISTKCFNLMNFKIPRKLPATVFLE